MWVIWTKSIWFDLLDKQRDMILDKQRDMIGSYPSQYK